MFRLTVNGRVIPHLFFRQVNPNGLVIFHANADHDSIYFEGFDDFTATPVPQPI